MRNDEWPESEQLVVMWAKRCTVLEKDNERLQQINRDLKAKLFDLENPHLSFETSAVPKEEGRE